MITAEEFALHADTLVQEFSHIVLVQNTCYRTLLPVSVTLTPEMQSDLLSHFDPEAPQDTPLPGIEPCLRVYSNLLHTEEGIACCIPLDGLHCGEKKLRTITQKNIIDNLHPAGRTLP